MNFLLLFNFPAVDMTPLSTMDINTILRENSVTRKYFLGTYPSCLTPRPKKKTYAFITNTDEHDMPGDHWNGWFVEGQMISFFDSFGRAWDDETLPEYYKDIVKPFEQVTYTNTRVQGWDSVACGYFCVHFLYIKSLGLDYKKLLDDYSKDFEENDNIVYDFFTSIY